MLARAAIFAVAASVMSVSAQLQILAPGGPNLWWVAQSENNIVWNCQESQFQNFTILVANGNPDVLVSPEAIIAIEPNFNCDIMITTQQANLPVADNYTVQFANPLNSSDIYAQSQPFAIMALGAAYPATSATPTASGTATGSSSSTGSAASVTKSSGASLNAVAGGPAGLAAMGVVLAGLVGMGV